MRLAGVLLIWLCASGWLTGGALADGLILDVRIPGISGPQADTALISPRTLHAFDAPVADRTYVVEAGDTLGAIATQLKTDVAQLVALNGLADPDRITPGMVLRVGFSMPPPPTLHPAGALDRVQLWPWPPAQGQTLAIWLRPREQVTLEVRFEDRTYAVQSHGESGWSLVPIPLLAAPGLKPLVILTGERSWRMQVPVQPGRFPSEHIPASASQAILSQGARVQAESERVAGLFALQSPPGWTPADRFRLPLMVDAPRTAVFGSRRTYGSSSAVSAHAGEDFSAMPGTPVYAPAEGRVVLAEELFVRGNAVVLDHGSGVLTGYWHLSAIDVHAGDQVKAGDRLGAVGSTGLSTGAHLHWELRVAGMAVDPMQWLAPDDGAE